jgi:cytochrome c5
MARSIEMTRKSLLMIAICTFMAICTLRAAQEKQTRPRVTSSPNAQDPDTYQSAQGEKLFHTHCGRCHNAPESISPKEARAVVRHMRVRATLTNEDERLILKFLAP